MKRQSKVTDASIIWIWNPRLRKDISAIDSVQIAYWKIIHFEPLSVRTEEWGLRRHRTDLIETYKYINKKYKTSPQSLFSVPNRSLRWHNDKIFKPYASTNVQKYFFSSSFELWNDGIYCLLIILRRLRIILLYLPWRRFRENGVWMFWPRCTKMPAIAFAFSSRQFRQ